MSGRMLIAGVSGWLGREVRAEGARRGLEVVGVARTVIEAGDIAVADGAEIAGVVRSWAPSLVVNCVGSAVGGLSPMTYANVEVARDLLEAATDMNARFVHVGSAAEIGDPGSDAPLAEDCRLAPISDYGRTKAQGSMVVINGGGDAVVARLFNIAGPTPPDDSFLADLIAKIRRSTGPVLLGNADMVRDWIAMDFAVNAILALGQIDHGERLVHVCSGHGITHGELAAALGRRLGRDLEVISEGLQGVQAVVGDDWLLRETTGLYSTMNADDLAGCILPERA